MAEEKKKPKRKIFLILALVGLALFVTSDKGKELINKHIKGIDSPVVCECGDVCDCKADCGCHGDGCACPVCANEK